MADTAFSDVMAEIEGILNNPAADGDDLERAKDLAESVNKHDQNNPECDTGTGSGTKSGTGSGNGSETGSKKGKK